MQRRSHNNSGISCKNDFKQIFFRPIEYCLYHFHSRSGKINMYNNYKYFKSRLLKIKILLKIRLCSPMAEQD